MSDEWQTVGGGNNTTSESKGKKGKKGKPAPEPVKEEPQTGAGSNPTMYAKAEALLEEKERKKQERENPPPQPKQPAENAAGKGAKGGKKKEGGEKSNRKPTDSSAELESRVNALSVQDLASAWESAKTRFPNNKEEWLKSFGDYIITAIGNAPLDEQKLDSPLCFVSPEQKKQVVSMLIETVQELPDILASSIENLAALDKSKPSAGLRLFIQFLLICDASYKQAHIASRAAIILRNKLKDKFANLPVELVDSIVYVTFQIRLYAPHTALLVWKALLIPVIWSEHSLPAAKQAAVHCLAPFVVRNREQLTTLVKIVRSGLESQPISPLSFHGTVFNPRELSAYLFLAYTETLSESLRQVLVGACPLFRELALLHPVRVTCLPFFLSWSLRIQNCPPLYSEVVRFIVRSLLLDPSGFTALLDRLPTAETAEKQGVGIEEVLVAVNGLSYAITENWAMQNIAVVEKFFQDCEKRVRALLANSKVVDKLGDHAKAAHDLARSCHDLYELMQPYDDSAWILWVALIVALFVFVILVAHLGCQDSTILNLPPTVCEVLDQYGVIAGVNHFYEFASPALPYVERAVVAVQPYVEVVFEAAQPIVASASTHLEGLSAAAHPYFEAVREFVQKALNRN